MSSAQELNRKRAKRPKTKSGCATCKTRRVKCDEVSPTFPRKLLQSSARATHLPTSGAAPFKALLLFKPYGLITDFDVQTQPECLRCLRFGEGYCDGYDSGKGDQSERRVITPRDKALAAKPTPKRDPVIQVFNNQDEFSCFRLYCEEVAPQLSRSNRSVWHQLLLQAGQDQAFIRHAIISIGALKRPLKTMRMGISQVPDRRRSSIANDPEKLESVKIYAFALEQYGRFLHGVKSHIPLLSKEQGRRMAMIACLLVVCIETMQFHFGNSLNHAQSGLSLFEDLMNDGLDIGARDGMSSPKPKIIEDELVQQFYRMELQVMAVYDTRAPSAHWRLGKEGTGSIRDMPKGFTSVEQARLHLDLVMRRTYHFMTYALADRAAFLKFTDVGIQQNIPSRSSYNFEPSDIAPRLPDASDELQVQQEIYCSENRRWSQAFEPLYRSALRNIEQAESIRVLLLKIHSLTTKIRLAGHLSKTEMIYDNYMADFEKIVELGKVVLNHPHANRFFAEGSFSLDLGLIYCLMTPAMDCRDRHLRREAIGLLSMRSWREAQWGSETSADVAKWILEVEEDGVDTDSIPEWARARLSVIDASLENKTAHLYCIRGVGESLTHKDSLRYWGDLGG